MYRTVGRSRASSHPVVAFAQSGFTLGAKEIVVRYLTKAAASGPGQPDRRDAAKPQGEALAKAAHRSRGARVFRTHSPYVVRSLR